jgi:2-amino-4-hydroxy-6-hydroxymethyldihydropteridine diphosphokinase
VIKQDILENQAKIVFLAIGSNLGNKIKNIILAKYKLQTYPIKIIKSSSNYETISWPNYKNPKFINIVIKVQTFLSPKELLKICNNIEHEMGRRRKRKNEPRICDIDIIDYDQKIIKYHSNLNLVLPHSEMTKRNFVLLPLFELTKSWKHPISKFSIIKLINLLKIKDLRAIKQI